MDLKELTNPKRPTTKESVLVYAAKFFRDPSGVRVLAEEARTEAEKAIAGRGLPGFTRADVFHTAFIAGVLRRISQMFGLKKEG